MIISTFGTKVCDDATAFSRRSVVNINRLVEISPFTIDENFNIPERKIDAELPFSYSNEYLQKVFDVEYRKEVLSTLKKAKGYVVIDMMICRLFFREFVFEDNRCIRLTESATTMANALKIRQQLEKETGMKVISEKVVNPQKFNILELEREICEFAQVLREEIGEDRLVLLKGNNIYHYISKNNTMETLSNFVAIEENNAFFDICNELICKYLNCQVIELPKYMVGDSRVKQENMFHYSRLYYEYIVACLNSIGRGDYTQDMKEELIRQYEIKQKLEIDEIILKHLVDLAYARRKGRKIILVGNSEVFEYNLKKKYGVEVAKRIEYNQDSTIEDIMEQMKGYEYKQKEYFCVVPYLYTDSKVLEAVWRCGYGLPTGCISIIHNMVKLENFKGRYRDFYNNDIRCDRPMYIELRGSGNKVSIGSGTDDNVMRFILLNQTTLTIGDNSTVGVQGMTATMYDGSTVKIGDNVRLGTNSHIRGSFFNTTVIGSNTEVDDDAVIFNGDGHAIIDLHTGNNINYDLNNSSPDKHEIIIGDNVYLGNGSFVLSGAVIADDTVVRDKSFVNKKYDKPCFLAGQPARPIDR